MTYVEPSLLEMLLTRLMTWLGSRKYYGQFVLDMGLKDGERVIDYGSGSGGASVYLARLLPHGHLTCVDISPKWMNFIKKKLGNYPNVDFQLGDIVSLDIPDHAYDAIVISLVFHDIEPGERIGKLTCLVNKLKMGGKIFLREPISNGHGMPVTEIRDLMSKVGMKEVSNKMTTMPTMGPLFVGTFEKI